MYIFVTEYSTSMKATIRQRNDLTTDTVMLHTASKIKRHPPTSIDRDEQLLLRVARLSDFFVKYKKYLYIITLKQFKFC